MSKSKRKTFIINPDFQYKLIGSFLLLFIILSTMNLLGMKYFFSSINEQALVASLPPDHVFIDFLVQQKKILFSIFLIVTVLSFVGIFVFGLLISHRIAGPLYRLKKHLEASSPWEIGPVEFRKGDFFQDFKKAFNDHIRRG